MAKDRQQVLIFDESLPSADVHTVALQFREFGSLIDNALDNPDRKTSVASQVGPTRACSLVAHVASGIAPVYRFQNQCIELQFLHASAASEIAAARAGVVKA